MSDWLDALDEAIGWIEDVDSRALILLRLEGQYVPALRNARTPEQVWRAWEAFRYYLTARETNRKPFRLTPDDADRVISTVQRTLDLPPHAPLQQ